MGRERLERRLGPGHERASRRVGLDHAHAFGGQGALPGRVVAVDVDECLGHYRHPHCHRRARPAGGGAEEALEGLFGALEVLDELVAQARERLKQRLEDRADVDAVDLCEDRVVRLLQRLDQHRARVEVVEELHDLEVGRVHRADERLELVEQPRRELLDLLVALVELGEEGGGVELVDLLADRVEDRLHVRAEAVDEVVEARVHERLEAVERLDHLGEQLARLRQVVGEVAHGCEHLVEGSLEPVRPERLERRLDLLEELLELVEPELAERLVDRVPEALLRVGARSPEPERDLVELVVSASSGAWSALPSASAASRSRTSAPTVVCAAGTRMTDRRAPSAGHRLDGLDHRPAPALGLRVGERADVGERGLQRLLRRAQLLELCGHVEGRERADERVRRLREAVAHPREPEGVHPVADRRERAVERLEIGGLDPVEQRLPRIGDRLQQLGRIERLQRRHERVVDRPRKSAPSASTERVELLAQRLDGVDPAAPRRRYVELGEERVEPAERIVELGEDGLERDGLDHLFTWWRAARAEAGAPRSA